LLEQKIYREPEKEGERDRGKKLSGRLRARLGVQDRGKRKKKRGRFKVKKTRISWDQWGAGIKNSRWMRKDSKAAGKVTWGRLEQRGQMVQGKSEG